MREVIYSPRAQDQIGELYAWIAEHSGFTNRAESYVNGILDYCDRLADFPFMGVARDDLRPGLRTLGFRNHTVIAFAVTDTRVEILGIYHGGRDYESLIGDDAR